MLHSPASLTIEREAESGRLIVVSNRGPIEHYIDENGHIRRREAGGGVAVALSAAARARPLTWIAGAGSFADRVVALTGRRISLGNGSELKLVGMPDEAYGPFYEVFCNPLLWFIQHSLTGDLQRQDLSEEALSSWQSGYVPVNRLFAEAVIEEVDARAGQAQVMLHDYHLYLAPRLIREAKPDLPLQQFVHIPWPGPATWYALPPSLVRQLCHGLLANDSLAFQTDSDVANFLDTCRAFLCKEARVSDSLGEVEYLGRMTSVWSNPVSVDSAELEELVSSPEVAKYRRELEPLARGKTIVRVDRLDPSKNVLRGFEAFERLLQTNVALHGGVTFLAFLVPSRSGIGEYDDYAREVFDKVAAINSRFGGPEWTPIHVFHEQNRAKAMAGLCLYDVLLVNSVADGMNLVSKEGPVVNEREGVLVLSVSAGSYAELGEGALPVNPMDVSETARALQTALAMAPAEKTARMQRLRAAIARHQASDWLRHQLKDLAVVQYMKQAREALLQSRR